jgi:UDP-glucose 4-epimerase
MHILVCGGAKARAELGWAPVYTDLAPIIPSAWRWHQNPRF